MYNNRRRRSVYKIDAMRLLIGVAIAVFIALDIITGIHVLGQNSEITRIDSEIEQLVSQSDNYTLGINQYYDLDKIRERAEALGMVVAEGEQVRIINMPSLVAAANADNTQP